MTWIQTYDGQKFDLLNPDADTIDPVTLSRVLSRICRFGGHCQRFYSVAQHSVLVCDLVEEPELKLAALLHDAHEAYWGFGDVCRPAKCLTQGIQLSLRNHAVKVDRAIALRFGLDERLFESKEIKHADNVALATEARDLMAAPPVPWDALPPPHPETIKPWTMGHSHRTFSRRLAELLAEK